MAGRGGHVEQVTEALTIPGNPIDVKELVRGPAVFQVLEARTCVERLWLGYALL